MRVLLALIALPLLGAAPVPEMRPEVFFAGRTTSWGELTMAGRRQPRSLRVTGRGTTLADGGFRLDQVIRYGDGQVTRRHWVMRRDGPTGYRATLSDAAGPVTGEVKGDLFSLRYRLSGPVTMRQELRLQPDGRTVMNTGIARLGGVLVARLNERITREE